MYMLEIMEIVQNTKYAEGKNLQKCKLGKYAKPNMSWGVKRCFMICAWVCSAFGINVCSQEPGESYDEENALAPVST